MPFSAVIILFIFGAALGSFLNVVTLRYELLGRILITKRIGGRSHCPQCGVVLRWYELIPILSFIIQRGRCRHCSYRLSLQYPIIEIITGLLTAGIPVRLYARFAMALLPLESLPAWFILLCIAWVIAAYVFLVLSLIDLKHTIIPDAANILLGALGFSVIGLKIWAGSQMTYNGSFLSNYAIFLTFSSSIWFQVITAVLLGVGLFGAIIVFTRGRGMGLGDLKLVAPIGLLVGWPDIVLVLALSFIIGALISLFLMAKRRKSIKDGVPFGPFLALAVFMVMFFGESIMKWYFSLL